MGFVEKMCIIDVNVKNSMNIIIPRALIFYCYKMDIYNLYYVCVSLFWWSFSKTNKNGMFECQYLKLWVEF